MELTQEAKNILIKPVSQWSSSEGNLIYKLMQENGRESIKQEMESLRLEAVKQALE